VEALLHFSTIVVIKRQQQTTISKFTFQCSSRCDQVVGMSPSVLEDSVVGSGEGLAKSM